MSRKTCKVFGSKPQNHLVGPCVLVVTYISYYYSLLHIRIPVSASCKHTQRTSSYLSILPTPLSHPPVDPSIHLSSLHPPTHTYTPTYPSFPSDTLIHLPPVIHPPSTLHQSTQPSPPSNPSTRLLIQLQFPSIHHLHILPNYPISHKLNQTLVHTYIHMCVYLSF